MKSSPRTSIALCTYNGEAFLREQLASFSSQTQLPDELIVCDDGSTDGTMDLLAEYAAAAPFVVSIHRNSSNLGSTQNFAQAVGLCRGDIVFLSDQDDFWRPSKVATITSEFDRHSTAGLVFSNAALVDVTRQPLGQRLWDSVGIRLPSNQRTGVMDLFPRLTHEFLVTGSTLAFRKKYVSAILPIGVGWIHDAWITYITAAFADVVVIDEDLIEYRQHAGQQIGAPPQRKILGYRPASNTARILGMVHMWLYGSSNPQADITAVTLKNDVEQAFVRYQSALERLQLLQPRQDGAQQSSDVTNADDGIAGSIRLAALSELRYRVNHLAARCRIRSCPGIGSRIILAVGEMRRGGYHRSGAGWLTFLRDAAGL